MLYEVITIDPDDRWFGGLGHAICDLDTGSVLSVKEGEIYVSEVIQINKGENGIPRITSYNVCYTKLLRKRGV